MQVHRWGSSKGYLGRFISPENAALPAPANDVLSVTRFGYALLGIVKSPGLPYRFSVMVVDEQYRNPDRRESELFLDAIIAHMAFASAKCELDRMFAHQSFKAAVRELYRYLRIEDERVQ
jgi:hypothetical protein